MHARLITVSALAALLTSTACGQSETAPVAAVRAPESVADVAPPPPNGVEVLEPARHDALPASFPRDIPIPERLMAKSVISQQAGSYVAIFGGDLDPQVVYEFFRERLAAEGWTIDKALGRGPEYGLFVSKGSRITTVISTRIDGRLHVELGVSGGS